MHSMQRSTDTVSSRSAVAVQILHRRTPAGARFRTQYRVEMVSPAVSALTRAGPDGSQPPLQRPVQGSGGRAAGRPSGHVFVQLNSRRRTLKSCFRVASAGARVVRLPTGAVQSCKTLAAFCPSRLINSAIAETALRCVRAELQRRAGAGLGAAAIRPGSHRPNTGSARTALSGGGIRLQTTPSMHVQRQELARLQPVWLLTGRRSTSGKCRISFATARR